MLKKFGTVFEFLQNLAIIFINLNLVKEERDDVYGWLSLLQVRTAVYLDLANGSGQSGLGSTHASSGQMGLSKKMGRPKWIAQLMTLTRSFKGRVKTGLTRIFTHEKKKIYIYIYIYKMKINLIL
jgi:hypothetical protein